MSWRAARRVTKRVRKTHPNQPGTVPGWGGGKHSPRAGVQAGMSPRGSVHPRSWAYLLAVVAGFAFGALDQYLGSLRLLVLYGAWPSTVSQMSAPWLVLPFVFGMTQVSSGRAMRLGLVATQSALAGYFVLTLSPLEGVSLGAFPSSLVSLVVSAQNWVYIAAGTVTGDRVRAPGATLAGRPVVDQRRPRHGRALPRTRCPRGGRAALAAHERVDGGGCDRRRARPGLRGGHGHPRSRKQLSPYGQESSGGVLSSSPRSFRSCSSSSSCADSTSSRE